LDRRAELAYMVLPAAIVSYATASEEAESAREGFSAVHRSDYDSAVLI